MGRHYRNRPVDETLCELLLEKHAEHCASVEPSMRMVPLRARVAFGAARMPACHARVRANAIHLHLVY